MQKFDEIFNYSEPTVRVGIASGSGFGIILHGEFDITSSEENIVYSPLTENSFAEISGIKIGNGFHWQRSETERFDGTLQILRKENTSYLINHINVEKYLTNVISSEMNGNAPIEFLKAHAIISRSWLLRQIHNKQKSNIPSAESPYIRWTDTETHKLFDVCADDHCQRYHGKGRLTQAAINAVKSTHGMVLIDNNGKIADARFSKCCGGKTELFSTCWQNKDMPYLKSIDDVYCNPDYISDQAVLQTLLNDFDIETKDYYQWQETISSDQIRKNIKLEFGIDIGEIKEIQPLKRGASKRIHLLRISGTNRTIDIGKELIIRKTLSTDCLKSSCFEIKKENNIFKISGKGWGHGVGLCQIGAAVMGACGKNYIEILNHYYPGTKISNKY